jgi:4-hydroxythreonine-4-phosphate dehydrogenase
MAKKATSAKRSSRARGPVWPIVISVGCPAGIGPEISVQAALKSKRSCLLVGDALGLESAAAAVGAEVVLIEDPALPGSDDGGHGRTGGVVFVHAPKLPKPLQSRPGKPSSEDGAAQLVWVNVACDLVASGVAGALVTGPVSKSAVVAGAPLFASRSQEQKDARAFRGHTEHLRDRLGAESVVMAFFAEELVCALVTTHLPLARVPRAITKEAVETACLELGKLCQRLKRKGPIAVCGLNPHAGESGLLGHEESIIAEGMRAAMRMNKDMTWRGPIGAESAFRLAYAPQGSSKATFAGVVAMYHDQATIPMKLVGFGEAVNVSLGLPIIRTSVDHGTAYDLAGKGKADARGMHAAVELALRLQAS